MALTPLIAESKPEDKATMATLVVNLINQDNWPGLLGHGRCRFGEIQKLVAGLQAAVEERFLVEELWLVFVGQVPGAT